MAIIKAVYRYVDEVQRNQFHNAQCLLTISVGQEVHEGEKFESTVELVSQTFKSCIMLIDDSLQRHTMVMDRAETPEAMHELSVIEGERWLERNNKYYSQLTNLNRIIRWDYWLNHPQYLSVQADLKSMLQRDPSYIGLFNSSIDEFLRRYCARLIDREGFDRDRAYQLCFNYLLEECTAMVLWPELECEFEVYPSRRNQAMDETHKRFVLPHFPSLLHAVAIKFKNRKQLMPQQFEALGRTQNI